MCGFDSGLSILFHCSKSVFVTVPYCFDYCWFVVRIPATEAPGGLPSVGLHLAAAETEVREPDFSSSILLFQDCRKECRN